MHLGVKEWQWPPYVREILRILKPGNGWAQMIEFGFPFAISNNNSLPEDSALSKVFLEASIDNN